MIGWLDAQAGASGDMFVGALVDVGISIGHLQSVLDQLELGIELRAETVTRQSLGSTRVHVLAPETTHARHLADVLKLLDRLPVEVRDLTADVFRRLAQAEAAVHRTGVERVHFHEVGALDAIGDIVATVAGFVELGLDELHCSTVSLGSGSTRGAHGPLPIPAPAVLELLRHRPTTAGLSPFECTTPTGAALLAELVTHWGPMPTMAVGRVGSGAGARDPGEVVNALRLVLGSADAARSSDVVQLEANVDDLDPRLWPTVIARLHEAGASDAWLSPIIMKKGRAAFTVSAVCTRSTLSAVRAALFRETTTIGLRELPVFKHHVDWRTTSIDLEGHRIAVKMAHIDGEEVNRSVEWEDVLAAATGLGRSAKAVLSAATAKAELASFERPVS